MIFFAQLQVTPETEVSVLNVSILQVELQVIDKKNLISIIKVKHVLIMEKVSSFVN